LSILSFETIASWLKMARAQDGVGFLAGVDGESAYGRPSELLSPGSCLSGTKLPSLGLNLSIKSSSDF
jgi:hypothetical protein